MGEQFSDDPQQNIASIVRLGRNLYEGITDEQDYEFYMALMNEMYDIDLEEMVEAALCQD